MGIALGILFATISYFIGNISPATILAKSRGLDIKAEGSGNAGATNALRVMGKKAGLITLAVDVLKGFIPTKGFYLLSLLALGYRATGSERTVYAALVISALCGLAVFCGHVWPLLLKFQGGKGVATSLGVLLATDWRIALICLGIFAVVVALTKMVSLGSIIAAVSFLLIYFWGMFITDTFAPFSKGFIAFHFGSSMGYMALFIPFVVLVGVLVYKHRTNIERIIRGEENKLSLSKK